MYSDEQAIRKLIADWLEATQSGETAKILPLMADDVVFLLPGRSALRGRSAFAAAAQAGVKFEIDVVGNIQEIRVFGDWAYCWNQLTVIMTPRDGGVPISRQGPVLSVLNKRDGSWVIVRDANMLSAPD